MTKKKKRPTGQNGSMKGKPGSDGLHSGKNVIAKEELNEAMAPGRDRMSDG
ncbi:hypothetical protein [Bacillus marinisedimentorum]|uniref:hypothetical protein n=1 Tax=Bacillus marinisedimentorum TaxID=1821260 RepID=UPI0012FF828E|nr:hypothetical protein [Bacillus marinisedimentorum]